MCGYDNARHATLCLVGDNMTHDAAHTLLDTEAIDKYVDEHYPVIFERIFVSAGAAAHFENRFQ